MVSDESINKPSSDEQEAAESSDSSVSAATGTAVTAAGDTGQTPDDKAARGHGSDFVGKLKILGIVVVGILIAGIVLQQMIPVWWANLIGGIIGGSWTLGIIGGVLVGAACTVLPVAIIFFGIRHRPSLLRSGIVSLLAIVAAFPNLATALVTWVDIDKTRTARDIFNTEAPGFRGATLIGVIGGVVLAVLMVRYDLRRRKQKRARAELKAAAKS